MEYNAQVGRRIRSSRELMGLSRERFAELCDISDSFLADVERGKKSLTVKTLNKICVAANLSADYIVLGIVPEEGCADENLCAIIALLKGLPPQQLQYGAEMLALLVKAFRS
jgi:transcriptional regulator with XRE-family HTH domain